MSGSSFSYCFMFPNWLGKEKQLKVKQEPTETKGLGEAGHGSDY